jgi:hypothetical protein
MLGSCKPLILKRKGDVRRLTNGAPRGFAKEGAEKQGKPAGLARQFFKSGRRGLKRACNMPGSCNPLILKRKGDVRRLTNGVPRGLAKERAEKQGKPAGLARQFFKSGRQGLKRACNMLGSCKPLILKIKVDVRRLTNGVPRSLAKEGAEKQGKPAGFARQLFRSGRRGRKRICKMFGSCKPLTLIKEGYK